MPNLFRHLTSGEIKAYFGNKKTLKRVQGDEKSIISRKNYFYELGKVRGILDENDSSFAMGTQIFGAQLWNYDNEKRGPKELDGMVAPDSLVAVTVNNGIPEIIDTYGGYYSLKRCKNASCSYRY